MKKPIMVLVAAALLASCSLRHGVVATGALPPPDGAQMARSFVRSITTARHAAALPPVVRDPALDVVADKGLKAIEAGVPEGVQVIEHLLSVAPLADGLDYGVGFEHDTPGLDERTRELGRRRSGSSISERLLGADPALDGIGWSSGGPWSVVVLRARPLGPGDAPALRAALTAELGRVRPTMKVDPAVEAIAGDAVADGFLNADDFDRYGRVGGVPVRITHHRDGPHLPTSPLQSTLDDEGPGTLREAWLTRVGVAVNIGGDGTVTYLVLATGDTDRGPLNAQLDAAAARATDAVNGSRAEAALPPVRLDPALMAAAKEWTVESSDRRCFVGHDSSPRSCPGSAPRGADVYWAHQQTWWDADDPFDWYLAPADLGHDRLRWFGTAATIGPDGTVWAVILMAE